MKKALKDALRELYLTEPENLHDFYLCRLHGVYRAYQANDALTNEAVAAYAAIEDAHTAADAVRESLDYLPDSADEYDALYNIWLDALDAANEAVAALD